MKFEIMDYKNEVSRNTNIDINIVEGGVMVRIDQFGRPMRNFIRNDLKVAFAEILAMLDD